MLEGELPAVAAHGEGMPLPVVDEALDAIPRLREWGTRLAECRRHLDGSGDGGLGGL